MSLFLRKALLLLLLTVVVNTFTKANSGAYEQRRQAYIDTALAHFGSDAITLQAYRGVPVDSATLHTMLANIASNTTSDFDIVKLVRVLFYSSGQYDTIILPVLQPIPFWLTKSERTRVYWSENHMCMWMSSDWLLHQKYGRPIDANLDARLRHYLRLKVQYGFYEFFSSVYAPYCLSGLLNLADFAQDAEIKSLATQAAQRLLKDILKLTNDQGVFYPTAGRNYFGKYSGPYGQNHNNLIYLLTGMGQMPGGASHAGGFLASSTIEVDSITNSWVPTLDVTYYNGHSIDSGLVYNDSMASMDKVIFQWSAGEYFHPEVALATYQLLTDSDLWHHSEFAQFATLAGVPASSVPTLAEQLNVISKSSVIVGETISVYKHNSIILSSVHDFWKGKIGFQEIPVVANVGTTPVFPVTGEVLSNWDSRNANNENTHLPYVEQHKNVALIMYRPEPVPPLISYPHKEVSLYWRDADYDEIKTDSNWLIGRQGNNYVGVLRSCTGQINTLYACDIPNGQTWALVVGDSLLYGGFTNFQNLIHQAHFEDSWYYDSTNSQSVYYAKLVFDTTTIAYAWGVDTLNTGIATLNKDNNELRVVPNPATDRIELNLPVSSEPYTVKVLDLLGREIYCVHNANSLNTNTINIAGWPQGAYIIVAESTENRYSTKLLKH